MNNKLPNFD